MVIKVENYIEKKIIIDGKPASIRPNREQICYDLHIGESIKLPGDETRRPTPRTIRLKSNDCIRIETLEHLTVPNNVFGIICSRASLTSEGLVVANLKIDPNFQGKLVITVYNTSKNIITIDKSLPFCSLFFQTLEKPLSADAPIRTPPESKIITGNKIIETLIRLAPFIITFAASVISSLIASYIFGWMQPAPVPHP